MFTKKKLSEIKAELARRGISTDGNRLKVTHSVPQAPTELEKKLAKILDELEREVEERQKLKTGEAGKR